MSMAHPVSACTFTERKSRTPPTARNVRAMDLSRALMPIHNRRAPSNPCVIQDMPPNSERNAPPNTWWTAFPTEVNTPPTDPKSQAVSPRAASLCAPLRVVVKALPMLLPDLCQWWLICCSPLPTTMYESPKGGSNSIRTLALAVATETKGLTVTNLPTGVRSFNEATDEIGTLQGPSVPVYCNSNTTVPWPVSAGVPRNLKAFEQTP